MDWLAQKIRFIQLGVKHSIRIIKTFELTSKNYT